MVSMQKEKSSIILLVELEPPVQEVFLRGACNKENSIKE